MRVCGQETSNLHSNCLLMRIVFMGTPEFAVASLQALHLAGYEIVAVITAPDSDAGRKGINISAVKKYALDHGLYVLQPPRLKNEAFVESLRALRADLQVVVAFRMLPEVVWNMPPLGTINLHGSLLPQYRGAAPIHWAVMHGDTVTGVTTFRLKHEIDTGDVLFRAELPIGPDETTSEVHDKMMILGAELVVKTVKAIETGTAQPIPQLDQQATHAPKLQTATCRIDFNQPAQTVHNFIRGLSLFPGAWTTLDGKQLKLLRTKLAQSENGLVPGTLKIEKAHLYVAATDAWLEILELQPEGKKRMSTVDYLHGLREAPERLI
jgi:methionyl-tRNA formyltransferase